MGDTYYVRTSSLDAAAGSLENELARFAELTGYANRTAEELAGMWEGDARDAFWREQQERAELYANMQTAVRNLIDMLKTAATRYQATDAACSQLLRL